MADAPDRPDASKQDWRPTVFLPKTDFPMKAGLPQKEPAILARWQAEDLEGQVRASRQGRDKFILHDGPPYANGDIHIGHALNHILKDMVVRTQTLLGKDAPYVPGWDCHGLPIEWKVEEQYRKKKQSKDEVPVREFRAECRAYAQHWVEVQREQLKRLGIGGQWDKPYLTMSAEAEGTIVAELMKFAESGQLYRGAKPVMWSPVEKTALAEAEIEYENITSTQIDVAFEIVESRVPELVGAYAVIWTTTPWTIPVNQAIGFGPEIVYSLLRAEDGSKYLVAFNLVEEFLKRTGLVFSEQALSEAADIKRSVLGPDLAGTVARHPMHHLGGFFARPRPFMAADFVTTDQGTGLVHEAPDHGEEDFYLCQANGIDPVFAVTDDGRYRDDWLWLGGQGSVINNKFNSIEGPILQDLQAAGALLSHGDFTHSYPHSWRSKAKVIHRCTPQWFIAMDNELPPPQSGEGRGGGLSSSAAAAEATCPPLAPPAGGRRTLRQLALQAIADTRFVPEKGRNRIGSMVEGRPDWVISRQRAWGVPIALFVERKSGELLVDPEVNRRIVEAVRAEGVDAWDPARAADFLGPGRDPDDYDMQTDILDVWFDSGCTHVFTLESGNWPEQSWPADLYLEGSDQHRGWFQSSLLESCGTRGRAPYEAVLTHGFTMDAKGEKMSKSKGNVINPLDLMKEHGADILRLWALSVDSSEDHRIGKEILAGVADQYRKLRNTFRYLLGALAGFEEGDRVDVAAMPELERYMLHLTAELDSKLRQAVADFDFNSYTRLLSDFANNDLSAFYFDIRKDSLYCDVNALTGFELDKRRAYRTVLDIIFHALVRWSAPVLVFTAEEVWGTRYPEAGSVHLLEWPEIPNCRDESVASRMATARWVRQYALAEIEHKRRNKELGSSLEAEVSIDLPSANDIEVLSNIDLATLFIVSAVKLSLAKAEDFGSASIAVLCDVTANAKCGRCWRHLPEVSEDGALCGRCTEVVDG